jgi:hypothetical protein
VIHKSEDLVEIPCTDADLDEVLREAGIEVTPGARDALKDMLTKLEDHPLNKGRGKATVFVPGVNVHFRLVPTLYTAVIATLGTAVTIGTLPTNPLLGVATGVLTAAQVIKDIGNQFNHLNAQKLHCLAHLTKPLPAGENQTQRLAMPALLKWKRKSKIKIRC